jgi:hypothetical protein
MRIDSVMKAKSYDEDMLGKTTIKNGYKSWTNQEGH